MSRAWILAAALGAAFALFHAPEALAEDDVCEPPVSTCGPFQNGDALGWKLCPFGTTCQCVPSCPGCEDCAVRVCVTDSELACSTACDCAPGLGCFDGICLAGFAPVFCCDAHPCPEGEVCQDHDGVYGTCAGPDPACVERLRKVTRTVDWLVHKTNRCRSDDECVPVDTSTGCQGTCGAFVNKRHEDRFGKVLDKLDERICDGYVEDGCPVATWACQVVRGACVENRCEAVPWRLIPPGEPILHLQKPR